MVRGEDKGALTTDPVLNRLLGVSQDPIHSFIGGRVNVTLCPKLGWESAIPRPSSGSIIKLGSRVQIVSAAGSSLVSAGIYSREGLPMVGGVKSSGISTCSPSDLRFYGWDG